MFFISTEGEITSIKEGIKKSYCIDFFCGVVNNYNRKTETFIKTMLVSSKYGKQGITLEYSKSTNNIFKIISISTE